MVKCTVLGGPEKLKRSLVAQRRAIGVSGVAQMAEQESFDVGLGVGWVNPLGFTFPAMQFLASVALGACPPVEQERLSTCSVLIRDCRIRGEL